MSADADETLAPVDGDFLDDLLRRVAAAKPKRGEIGEEKDERAVIRGPANQRRNHQRLTEQNEEVSPIRTQDGPLPSEQDGEGETTARLSSEVRWKLVRWPQVLNGLGICFGTLPARSSAGFSSSRS
jgi:hypothetical protein